MVKNVKYSILIAAFLSACGIYVQHPKVFYKQQSRTQRIVKSSYSKDDTLVLKYYMCDHWVRTPSRRQPPDTVFVPEEAKWEMIRQSLSTTLKNVVPDSAPERFNVHDSFKEVFSEHFYRDKILPDLHFGSARPYIIPIVEYTAMWQNQLEGGGAKHTLSETGMVEYALFRTFAVAIVKDYNLIYYSNHYHRDTLTLKQGVELEHEFPQPMLDTLVTLAMKHYVERLE